MVGGAVDYKVVDLSIFDTSPERFALIPHVCRTKGNVILYFIARKKCYGRGAE